MKFTLKLNSSRFLLFLNKNHRCSSIIFSVRSCILIASFLFYGCSKQNKAVINARISNAGSSMTYLVELGSTTDKIIDSASIKRNGKFRFTIPIKTEGFYQLKFKERNNLTLILSPGEKIYLTSDLNDFQNSKKIEGSANSIRVNYLHDSLRSTVVVLNKMRSEYLKIADKGIDTSELGLITREYRKTIDTYRRFSIGYILEDLKSLANIAALFQEYSPGDYVFSETRDIQYYKLVSDTLGKYYPKVKQVRILVENYKEFYKNYQTERMIKMAGPVNNHLPDLKLPDTKGLEKSLSSYRGKLVLLSFWSVTDADCIENNSDLQKIYKKYRSKGFEIYQVSIDNSIKAWQKELTFDEITWVSVIDTAFYSSQTRGFYNVNELPLNYLLNSDQTELLGKNLNASELGKKLATFLK